jgi:hypothetical protein
MAVILALLLALALIIGIEVMSSILHPLPAGLAGTEGRVELVAEAVVLGSLSRTR